MKIRCFDRNRTLSKIRSTQEKSVIICTLSMHCINWAGGDKFRKKVDFGYRNLLKLSRMRLKPIHEKIRKKSVCHLLFCYIILEQKITGRIKICFKHCEKIKSRSKETSNSIEIFFWVFRISLQLNQSQCHRELLL